MRTGIHPGSNAGRAFALNRPIRLHRKPHGYPYVRKFDAPGSRVRKLGAAAMTGTDTTAGT